MRDVYKQSDSGVRFEWGLAGARALAPDNGCLVVVDVLSFTTTVSVAVSRSMAVIPYGWNDATASEFAAAHDASLAVGRSQMSQGTPWSLSPAALMEAPFTTRLVLPSPNGSTICAASDGLIVSASLRNASAVGQCLIEAGYGTSEKPVVVIASGEHWVSDNTLRPCLEDLLGAGMIIASFLDSGCVSSIEASVAAATYRSVDDIPSAIRDCASGRELIEDGFARDVDVASAVNADQVVPALVDGAFVDADVSVLSHAGETLSDHGAASNSRAENG